MHLFRQILLVASLTYLANAEDYGLDCSFPIHNVESSCGDLLGNRNVIYLEYMDGCRAKWGKKGADRCDASERDRIEMTRRQPQSMVNYTSTGFKKMRAPPALWKLISDYWQKNKDDMKIEDWGLGNVYTNNWVSPTYMASVENNQLRGGGYSFKNQIWEAARPTIEEWTGNKLKQTSLYGIRVYTEGAILSPHVDRLPLVSSCIINVDQENLEEEWVLEVYDRHDRAVNVTMKPGDMVLYESGSLVHGRPFALKGKGAQYANIFIHYEPTGERLDGTFMDLVDDFDPPYVLPDSPEIDNWERRNPGGWHKLSPSAADVARPEGHVAAAVGDLKKINQLASENRQALHAKDENGWQPIHEAVRAGRLDTVALLVQHGADINAVTNRGKGGVSPYNMAMRSFSPEHPISQYLYGMGAVNVGPEL